MRELAALIAELTGYDGEIRWDPSQPTASRDAGSTFRAPRAVRLPARPDFARACRTIAWYRSSAVAAT